MIKSVENYIKKQKNNKWNNDRMDRVWMLSLAFLDVPWRDFAFALETFHLPLSAITYSDGIFFVDKNSFSENY